jgi:predicted nuclease of predicted toxin-antitoxin system
MIIWLDAQLSPNIAAWISQEFSVSAVAVRDLGLRNAKDRQIFFAARQANAVIMTKDADFVHLVEQSGPPPQIILLACGNTSNSQLMQILKRTFFQTMEWIRKGEPVVEITAS